MSCYTRLTSVAVAGLLVLGCTSALAVETANKPNILFIYLDDWGWMDAGFMGSAYYETPNIDRLASNGMVFTDNYANAPLCMPSRACLMSGQYSPRHGVYIVSPSPGHGWYEPYTKAVRHQKVIPVQNGNALAEGTVGLGKAMQRAGYVTGFTGKWHHAPGPVEMGFDEILPQPQRNPKEDPKRMFGLTDNALRFVRKHRHEPFFFYLSHHTIHGPKEARPETIEYFQKKKGDRCHWIPEYAAMLKDSDEVIGRLLQALDDLKLADRTVVVLTSDNGASAKSSLSDPLASGKGQLYEGGIRVPLIVRWPGVVKSGSRCSVPVIATDFYPTFVDIAGGTRPAGHVLDGVSIVPLLRGTGTLKREALFWHVPCYYAWEIQPPEPFTYGFMRQTPCSVIRKGDWKLLEYFEDGRLELYDLKNDIGESRNLADTMPDKAADLLADLRAWRKDVDAPEPTEANPDYRPEYRIPQQK